MTDEQSLQIRKLRAQGMGYRAIAATVNLSRDIVRNYCRSNGIGGYRAEYEMNLKDRMNDGRACAFCGVELVRSSMGRPKRFCSELCRRSYWKIHRSELKKKQTAIYIMQCLYCHETFESYGNKKRKYCCHAHYILGRFGPEEMRAVPKKGAVFFMPEKEPSDGI